MKSLRLAAVVLAAGQSTRMGHNKLLADLNGAPLIRRTVEAVVSWRLDKVVVVTGHESDQVAEVLSGTGVAIVRNESYSAGMAASLRRGLEYSGDVDAVLVCLGDMPLVRETTARRLVEAFNPAKNRSICVPVYAGNRGNPVLWGGEHLEAMASLSGDQGAKALTERFADKVAEVETTDEGVVLDADTPEALARVRTLFHPRPA